MDGQKRRDAINDLDCIQCARWFPTFTALAEHVKQAHTTPDASGLWPSRARAYQRDNRKAEKMARLPKAKRATTRRTSTAKATSTGRIPASKRDDGAADFNPFLKAQDIGRGRLGDAAILVLTGNVRVSDGQFGEQIIAEVKHGRDTFDWAVKLNSPNHRYLEDTIGVETKRWKGKKVPVVIKENLGRHYIAIERKR